MMDIDVITKLPGFFNSNYYCLQCEKAYFNEDYEHHSCHKTKCRACLQSSCPDYELFKQSDKPYLPCKDCGRHFDGVTCQLNHLTCKPNGQLVAHDEKNVCKSHKNCSTCLHVFSSSVQEHMKHCGLQKCPSCSKEVNILQHKCYLQAVTHEKNAKEKTKSHNTLCSFISILTPTKTPETTWLISYVQKLMKTVGNSPSKVNIAYTNSYSRFTP